MELVAGIDIGGTTINMGLVNAEGQILQRVQLSTLAYPEPAQLVSALSQKVKALFYDLGAEYTLKGIGVGAPNGNFYKGTIEFAPNLKWFGVVPLADMIAKQMNCSCLLTNDANAAALGEMLFGAAKGLNDFIFITLGTGLGSGIVTNGKLVYGHDGFAGEMGHVIVVPEGRLCNCGRLGCLETYCSAPGLVKTYKEICLKQNPALQWNDRDINSRHIFELATQKNPEALEAFAYTAKMLGHALANAVAFTSPSAIFLFGGLSAAGDLLIEDVRKHMEDNLLNIYKGKIQVYPSGLPENDAAVLGAASLIWHQSEPV